MEQTQQPIKQSRSNLVSGEYVNRANLIAEHFHHKDIAKFAVTIGKPVEMVYAFWRQLSNLPLFMKDLKEVSETSERISRWVVELKNGVRVEWTATIVEDKKDELIMWRSIEGSQVETKGMVWFTKAPAGLGTEVSLMTEYKVPGGKLAEFIAKFTGEDADTLFQTNLRQLKALLETGEIPTIEGQSSGRDETYSEETQ